MHIAPILIEGSSQECWIDSNTGLQASRTMPHADQPLPEFSEVFAEIAGEALVSADVTNDVLDSEITMVTVADTIETSDDDAFVLLEQQFAADETAKSVPVGAIEEKDKIANQNAQPDHAGDFLIGNRESSAREINPLQASRFNLSKDEAYLKSPPVFVIPQSPVFIPQEVSGGIPSSKVRETTENIAKPLPLRDQSMRSMLQEDHTETLVVVSAAIRAVEKPAALPVPNVLQQLPSKVLLGENKVAAQFLSDSTADKLGDMLLEDRNVATQTKHEIMKSQKSVGPHFMLSDTTFASAVLDDELLQNASSLGNRDDPEPSVLSEQFAKSALSLSVHSNSFSQISRPYSIPHITRQIAEGVVGAAGKSVEIALNPIELGRVSISLLTGEGGLLVTVAADRVETLDLMRRNIDQLSADFEEIGHHNIEFNFSEHRDQQKHSSDEPAQQGSISFEQLDFNPQEAADITRMSGVDIRL